MFYRNKNTSTVPRSYILILFPSALLLKEHCHVKINLLPSHSLVRTAPQNSVHPKNSLNSLKPVLAKGDSDKLAEINDSGNTAFLKQIPSKNYIKKYLYNSGLLIFGLTHTELTVFTICVLTLLQYQLQLIWCRADGY